MGWTSLDPSLTSADWQKEHEPPVPLAIPHRNEAPDHNASHPEICC